jgi:alpha-galactosidase
MSDGSRAVILLNLGASETTIPVKWIDIGYPEGVSASVRDLWEHKDLGKKDSGYSASVPSHGVAMLLVKP